LFWYDQPSAYAGEPEIEFFDRVPTVWDETRVLDGRIGEFATIARRSGADWFVGTITSDAAREVAVPLAFLSVGKTYTAHLYENGTAKNAVNIRTESVTTATTLRAHLPAAGGQAIWLTPK
jgi:alpha-glucosidase